MPVSLFYTESGSHGRLMSTAQSLHSKRKTGYGTGNNVR